MNEPREGDRRWLVTWCGLADKHQDSDVNATGKIVDLEQALPGDDLSFVVEWVRAQNIDAAHLQRQEYRCEYLDLPPGERRCRWVNIPPLLQMKNGDPIRIN